METGHWYYWSGRDLVLHVHIQTRSKQDGPGHIHNGRLKLKIKAAPVEGKANKYLIGYLAKEFNLAKSDVEIVNGLTSRNKLVKIHNPEIPPVWFCELIQKDKQDE